MGKEPEVDITESFSKMKEALEVAKHMRIAQKTYFRTRKQEDLVASKRLETALDMRLLEMGI